jgi:hypothetical protein
MPKNISQVSKSYDESGGRKEVGEFFENVGETVEQGVEAVGKFAGDTSNKIKKFFVKENSADTDTTIADNTETEKEKFDFGTRDVQSKEQLEAKGFYTGNVADSRPKGNVSDNLQTLNQSMKEREEKVKETLTKWMNRFKNMKIDEAIETQKKKIKPAIEMGKEFAQDTWGKVKGSVKTTEAEKEEE